MKVISGRRMAHGTPDPVQTGSARTRRIGRIALVMLGLCVVVTLFGREVVANAPTGRSTDPAHHSAVVEAGPGDAVQSFAVRPNVWMLAWSPDGTRIATSAVFDLILGVWDWRQGKQLATIRKTMGGGGGYIAFTSDGRGVITTSITPDPDAVLSVWRYATGHIRQVPIPYPGFRWAAARFSISADGTRLALLPNGKEIDLYDSTAWQVLSRFPDPRGMYLAMSPSGREIAILDFDGAIRIVNAITGALRLRIQGWPYVGGAIAWSPDGRFIAAGAAGSDTRRNPATDTIETVSDSSLIKVWSAATGKLVAEDHADIGQENMDTVAFSHDSKNLASVGGKGGDVRIWSVQTMKLVEHIELGAACVDAQFSPSDQYLAIACADRVFVYDVSHLR